MELPFGDGFHYVGSKQQVGNVLTRDYDALITSEAATDTDIVEPLNLLVDTADRLNLTPLINRSRYGQVLTDRNLGQRGKDGVNLSRAGRVTVDTTV